MLANMLEDPRSMRIFKDPLQFLPRYKSILFLSFGNMTITWCCKKRTINLSHTPSWAELKPNSKKKTWEKNLNGLVFCFRLPHFLTLSATVHSHNQSLFLPRNLVTVHSEYKSSWHKTVMLSVPQFKLFKLNLNNQFKNRNNDKIISIENSSNFNITIYHTIMYIFSLLYIKTMLIRIKTKYLDYFTVTTKEKQWEIPILSNIHVHVLVFICRTMFN